MGRTLDGRRIVLLGPGEPPIGGVSRYCRGLSAALRDAGAEVTTIDPSGDSAGQASSWLERLIDRAAGSDAAAARRASRESRPALVIDNFQHFWRRSRYAWTQSHLARAPYVLAIHHGGFEEAMRSATQRGRGIVGRSLGRIAGVLCMGRHVARAVEQLAPGARAATVTPLLPRSSDPAPPEEDLGRYICMSGALAPHYGVEDVLQGFERMLAAGTELKLVLLVGSFHETPEIVRRVEGYRELLGRDRVVVLRDHPEGERIVAAAEVYVRCSTMDSFGLALHEAMHAGVPVVASRIEGRPAGILIYESGDVGGLQRQIGVALGAEARDAACRHRAELDAAATSNLADTLRFIEAAL